MRQVKPVKDELKGFGDIVTCDHLIAESEPNKSVEDDMYGVMFYDVWSDYLGAYPVKSKTGVDTSLALQHFRGKQHVQYVYSDGAGEINFACKVNNILHDSCMPGEKQANGIAERQVQEVKL